MNATLGQAGVYLLVDFRADPLDQSFGYGAVVVTAEFGVDGRRCGDVLVCPLIHGVKYIAIDELAMTTSRNGTVTATLAWLHSPCQDLQKRSSGPVRMRLLFRALPV